MGVTGAYVLMVFLTVATPGPGQLMTIGNAMGQGWKQAMLGVLGLALGTVLMSSLSVLGMGTLLTVMPGLLTLLKLAGAVYLLYLSQAMWRSACAPQPAAPPTSKPSPTPAWTLLRRGLLLQTVNPKPVLFFMAVLPRVAMEPASATLSARKAALAIGLYVLALLIIHGSLAAAAVTTRHAPRSPLCARLLKRCSSVCFALFAGLLLFK